MSSPGSAHRPDLVDLLCGEHAAILTLLGLVEKRLPGMRLGELRAAGETLDAVLMAHALSEDGLLFQSLPVNQAGVSETLEAMAGEHGELRRNLETLRGVRSHLKARALLQTTIELAREHFAVEERVLFEMARELTGQARLAELGAQFAKRRGLSPPPA